ncbi:hypothetical protein BDN71DRAFT_1433392 [Pleurotus eryngii]|uniref:Uncharacterized protein n=1 Tax=Pleurotus eryngii TaxID=5323 RepID=A0A9P6DE70_PLEER|nr:hypothetical protein BDN71DRAFT_1433392 [Pleurotus eryngii]
MAPKVLDNHRRVFLPLIIHCIDNDDQWQQQAAKENSSANDNNDNGKEPGDMVDIEPTDTQTEELTEQGEKIRRKKEQLRTWFHNNLHVDTHPKSVSFLYTIANNLMKQSQMCTCARRPVKLYSKSHYQLDGIKAKVNQHMIDKVLKGKVETKAEVKHCWMKIYNKEIGQAWGAVDPTLRKETEEKADTTVALSLTELQQHIQLLPVLIPPLLQQLQAKTGWAFSLLVGGPLPIANRDIDVCTFHIRETVLGNLFCHVYRDFQEGVLRPYTEFVRLVFTAKPSSQATIEKNLELPVPSFPILDNPFALPTSNNDQSLTAELFRDLPLFDPQLITAHATTDFRALNDRNDGGLNDGGLTWEAGTKAVNYMLGLGLGDDWLSLMKSWVHLETSLGFGEGVDGWKMWLTTEGRLLQLKDWMQRHRPYTPNTKGCQEMVEYHATPAWQQVDRNTSQVYVPSENEDWSELAKASTNGLLLLMLSVGWWGKIETSDA